MNKKRNPKAPKHQWGMQKVRKDIKIQKIKGQIKKIMEKDILIKLRYALQKKIADNLRECGIKDYHNWYSAESLSEKDIDEVFKEFEKELLEVRNR